MNIDMPSIKSILPHYLPFILETLVMQLLSLQKMDFKSRTILLAFFDSANTFGKGMYSSILFPPLSK